MNGVVLSLGAQLGAEVRMRLRSASVVSIMTGMDWKRGSLRMASRTS